MKIYSLTKKELEAITQTLPLISHYEQVLEAFRQQFRSAIISTAFKRLDISPEFIEFCKVDITGGNIEIDEPKKEEIPAVAPTTEKAE